MNVALLLLRIVVGLLFIGQGTQKLFGWFGGDGPAGTAKWMGSIGFTWKVFGEVVAGLSQAAGGLFLVLGLFDPLGSIGIGASMLTAIAKVHWPKLWATKGGNYHQVSKKYLPLYLAEFTFRHNHRKDPNLFDSIVAGC
jgi:putative oxidoreductase